MTLVLNGTTGVSAVDGTAATPAIQGNDSNTGMFFPAADTIAFAEGGTEVARFDSSGNLGIGTSSPLGKLDVALTAGSASGLYFSLSGSETTRITTNSSTGEMRIGQSNVSAGNYFQTFYTVGSERARIDTSGNLLVGAATQFSGFVANARLYVQSSTSDYAVSFRSVAATPYGVAMSYSTAPNNGTSNFFDARDSSAQRFAVFSNGGIANFSANNSNLSDRREKTNFAPAGSYLSKICAIPVQTFNYIDQNLEEDPGLTLGVVAQDVQSVAPELVMESNWGTAEEPKQRLSIYQTDLQYALMKCIQELKAEVDALKAQLGAQA